jgi:signal transduction histidine kinase
MRFRSPFEIRFLLQLFGFGILVASLIVFLFFALDAYIDSKRDIELQKLGNQASEIFRQNIVDSNTSLSLRANTLDLNRKSFVDQAQIMLNQNPAILSIEIRNQLGTLVESRARLASEGGTGPIARKVLPPWLLSDFELALVGQSPKLSGIYRANPAVINSMNASDVVFLVDEFFPMNVSRMVMVVTYDPRRLFFSENLIAFYQKESSFRFELESDNQVVIASSDNTSVVSGERTRFVIPINYGANRTLFFVIETASAKHNESARALQFLVIGLAGLIIIFSFMLLRGWRQHSHTTQALKDQEQRLLEQSKFVAMGEISTILSHELNQPLTTIETYSAASQRLLTQSQPDTEKLLKAVTVIRDEAARISKIIKNIRSFITQDSKKIQAVDVASLMEDLHTILQMQAAQYQAQLTMKRQGGFTVEANRFMLEQVVLNLARNAFEAMLSGSSGTRMLTITVTQSEGEGQIIFSDTGPGISPEVGPKLFTPFFSTKSQSMGIGLSLCRSLVERYNGSLRWENNPRGGAQFTISFRLTPA